MTKILTRVSRYDGKPLPKLEELPIARQKIHLFLKEYGASPEHISSYPNLPPSSISAFLDGDDYALSAFALNVLFRYFTRVNLKPIMDEWGRAGNSTAHLTVRSNRVNSRQVAEIEILCNFLSSECQVTGNSSDFERVSDLHNAFNAYCLRRGASKWGPRTFGNALKLRSEMSQVNPGRCFILAKVSNKGYRGLVLKANVRNAANKKKLKS